MIKKRQKFSKLTPNFAVSALYLSWVTASYPWLFTIYLTETDGTYFGSRHNLSQKCVDIILQNIADMAKRKLELTIVFFCEVKYITSFDVNREVGWADV